MGTLMLPVSGSDRDILGTSIRPVGTEEGCGEDGATATRAAGGEGARMIGGVGGGVGNPLEDDVEGLEEARRPDIRLPAAHSKSSALSPGLPAFHL